LGLRRSPYRVLITVQTFLGEFYLSCHVERLLTWTYSYLAGGDSEGSSTMASLINSASTKCPKAKLVLGGYSQGAQLVHNAAKTLSAAVTAKIAAVIVFGDPDRGQAVGTVATSKVDSICHAQDIICTGSGGFETHLTYGDDAPAAASFIVSAVGSV
jgi:cutinase